jgi:hypothetical protein
MDRYEIGHHCTSIYLTAKHMVIGPIMLYMVLHYNQVPLYLVDPMINSLSSVFLSLMSLLGVY